MPVLRYKTEPYPHQRELTERTCALDAWGLFWEQGTGKTKPVLDTASYLAGEGLIDALLIVAPSGVAGNWVKDEVPAHLAVEHYTFLWSTQQASTKRHQASADLALALDDKFMVAAMSYDSLMTNLGANFAKEFLIRRRCLYVLDEADHVKTPSAKRTIRAIASGKYARFRRVLTGTPVDESPFDVYTQLKFLKPDIWNDIGCRNFAEFKVMFGIWEQRRTGERFYPALKSYKNLDILRKKIDSISDRVLKADVLNLPPKTYTKRYFELTAEQSRCYKELKEEYVTLVQTGQEVLAPMALVRLTRFQQITSGFLPTPLGQCIHPDNDEEGVVDYKPEFKFHPNPRLRLLIEVIQEIHGQFIIWAKFNRDITDICRALDEEGITFVRYDGAIDEEQRAINLGLFKDGTHRAFVSKAQVGGTGLTLNQAKTVVYYNNTFRLKHRLQSEDRCHRLGQDQTVRYIDLVAEGTVDEKILAALRTKRDIASQVTGDELLDWI